MTCSRQDTALEGRSVPLPMMIVSSPMHSCLPLTLTHSLTLSCTTEELSAPRDLTDEPLVALPSPPALMDPDPLLQVGSPYTKSLPQPIGRPERPSSSTSEGFQKAPGAEVKSRSLEDDGQVSE